MRTKYFCEPGDVFNRLTVISVFDDGREKRVLVRCSCGTEKEIRMRSVVSRHTKSCGCAQKESAVIIGKNRAKNGHSARQWLFNTYRQSARKKGHTFALNWEVFFGLVLTPCHYCGAAPMKASPDCVNKYGKLVYNGLDRINNERGYVADNVVPCCWNCNRWKSDFSQDQFRLRVQAIAKHWLKMIRLLP